MSVHDWTSHWFDHPAATSAPDADPSVDASDLAEALAGRDAEVTVLTPRDSRLAHAEPPAPMPDLDVPPDNALSQDLAALSRVILGIAADPESLPGPESGAAAPRGSRIRSGAPVDEAPQVPGRVVGGARARRDVPVLVGTNDDEDQDRPRGKHAAPWTEEVVDLDPATVREPAAAGPGSWQAPAPFELEPEPVVEVEPLRWAEAAELGASLGIDLIDPSAEWTEGSAAPDLHEEQAVATAAPEQEPTPAPDPVVSWDTLANVPATLTADAPATSPAQRSSQNAASLLRELSFLD